MAELELCCPTLFGLEGIVADELRFEGKIEKVQAENGRVLFWGDAHTLAWANLNLRCAERVLIRLAAFRATSFDMLFEGVKAIAWEDWIGQQGAFPVKGHALQSKLHSVPDCQKIVKKAIVSRLSAHYGNSWFAESGEKYQIQFSIMNDKAEIFLDTSGAGLHKRGYRANANAAPLRETLAAAMVKLARWRGREPMLDPFCGSGTIPIEAAMIASRRAPGLLRSFAAEQWPVIDRDVWRNARETALGRVENQAAAEILASDIDSACVELSAQNARKAGVYEMLHLRVADALQIPDGQHSGGLFVNPPYGERLLDQQQARALYRTLGQALKNSQVKQYILASDPEFEQLYGRKADKRRKLYNGMLKCELHMYFRTAAKDKPYVHK